MLYAALGCPWAGRCLIVRELKGLQDYVDVSILNLTMGPDGSVSIDGNCCPASNPYNIRPDRRLRGEATGSIEQEKIGLTPNP
jgi:glutathionyl-hydroquinone reductase